MSIEIGRIYGLWKVLEPTKKPEHIKSRAKYFLCECQCSRKTRKPVMASSIKNGKSLCCGCMGDAKASALFCKNEIGKTFGKVTVLAFAKKHPSKKGRGKYFLCQCECGTREIVSGTALRKGVHKHCGCMWRWKGIRNKDAPFNQIMATYKITAKRRKKVFNLSLKEIKKLTQSPCYYCGSPPKTPLTGKCCHNLLYNGIDRLNNEIGYFSDNCVPCCKICNTAKMTMSVNAFIEWVSAVYNHICCKPGSIRFVPRHNTNSCLNELI